jgi:hypothetical protein
MVKKEMYISQYDFIINKQGLKGLYYNQSVHMYIWMYAGYIIIIDWGLLLHMIPLFLLIVAIFIKNPFWNIF